MFDLEARTPALKSWFSSPAQLGLFSISPLILFDCCEKLGKFIICCFFSLYHNNATDLKIAGNRPSTSPCYRIEVYSFIVLVKTKEGCGFSAGSHLFAF